MTLTSNHEIGVNMSLFIVDTQTCFAHCSYMREIRELKLGRAINVPTLESNQSQPSIFIR